MKALFHLFTISLLIILLTACPLIMDDIDPELKKQHESYLTLVEFHAFKQVLMYEYFGLFSNNFQNPDLFEYEPTQEECMAYFSKIEQLLAYEEKLVEAADLLQNAKSQVSNSNDYLLKSAMARWDWLLKYVPFKGKNIELRNKIVTMSKDFTDDQRKYLFDLLHKNPTWKGGALNEAQFFSKMEDGELDNSILRIHNTFEEDSERGDYFNWAEQNKLLSTQLAYEYGKEGLETGEKVLVTTVKNLNPSVGTAVDILDYSNKFLNYINNAMSGKTIDQYQEELKNSIEEKGYDEGNLEPQGNAQQQTLSIVEKAKLLEKIAKVCNNPESAISLEVGWGGVKITSEDKSLNPDVVMAERLNSEEAPVIVLSTEIEQTGNNEWIVPLPEGDWDIVAVDDKGQSDTVKDWSVITRQFGLLNMEVYKGDDENKHNDDEDNDYGCDCGWNVDFSKLSLVNEGLKEYYVNESGLKHGPYIVWHNKDERNISFYCCYYVFDGNSKKHGKQCQWHENGERKQLCYFNEGKYDGLLTNWWDDGTKSYEANYKDGEFHGSVKQWSFLSDGTVSLISSKNYVDGLLHGIQTSWYTTTGSIQQETNYKMGIKHGVYRGYSDNGNLATEGTYKDGEPVGIWKHYNEDGSCLAIFDNDTNQNIPCP
ncbi:MAG: toxin-antitoxin system YwqK family antitoxin [Prolixibacteraceae bacterium]|nr:toxin-antitoxin system YwqK family antitoxin [Prolixibacteraceae bacterium]